jgi:hypothetical protein
VFNVIERAGTLANSGASEKNTLAYCIAELITTVKSTARAHTFWQIIETVTNTLAY